MTSELVFRKANSDDVEQLVHMLADDALGSKREDLSSPLNPAYQQAFAVIDVDPNNELILVEQAGSLAGMLQLTFIPYLTHVGSWRCLIEGVRIARSQRGQGLGTLMLEWAIERARERGCAMVQLTADKQRAKAHRFYEALGFKASHEGMKLKL